MKNLFFLFIANLLSLYCYGTSPMVLQGGDNPSLHVDFDDCVSWFNGYNEDYSEFTAVANDVENCSRLELAGPGYVYRNKSETNIHSCTEGIDSTSIGMCITGLDNCNYIAGDSTSLLFNVRVIPGSNGMGSLEELSFYEKAPLQFNFYQGGSGTNNYPTKFGIRVLVDSVEVYSESDINTLRDWNLRTFNFSNVEAFTVTDTTIFNFEILPYCLVGADSPISAWDIDNMTITAGCNNVNAGFVKVIGNVNICQDDTLSSVLTLEAENAFGSNLSWLILNGGGEIIEILDDNEVDFETFDNGIYSIYHLAYGDDLTGLELGNVLDDLEGCFDLSSRIVIVNNKLVAGELTSGSSTGPIQICSDDAQQNIVELTYDNETGIQTNFILLSDSMEILAVSLIPTFDLSSYGLGQYSIIAITHNGQLINAAPGNLLSEIQGCVAVSNVLNIEKDNLEAGEVTLLNTVFCVGDGNADLLEAEVNGVVGGNARYIVTDEDSTILSTPTLPIDLDLAVSGQCLLWHVVSIDSLVINPDMHISEINGNCFDLSEPASFLRIDNTAGLVAIEGGSLSQTICVSDSLPDFIVFENSGNAAVDYQYIVTDSANVVISVSDIDTIDFTNAPVGVCRVWGVAHDGSFDIAMGDTLLDSLATGCTDFTTNFVEVIRVDAGVACGEELCNVEGGIINLTDTMFCIGDGESDLVDGDLVGAVGDFMQLVVTDSDSTIIALPGAFGFDVDLADEGTCVVWNVSSTDTIALAIGMSVFDVGNDCFGVSNGAVFQRVFNDGGMVSLDSGETSIEVCVGDSISNILSFITTGNGQSYQYIITDTSNVIIAIPNMSQVDFEDAEVGTCRVWGLAHNSVYDQVVGDTLLVNNGAGTCFDLSSNFIEVDRVDCSVTLEAGSITLSDGSVEFCPDDSTGVVVNGNVNRYDFSSNLDFRSLHETDLDGDSQPDYIIAERANLDWVEHDGVNNALVTTPLTHDFPFNFGVSQLGDMDNDGDIDIVTVAFGTDDYDVYLLSNDGSNAFTSKELADSTWHAMSLEPKEIQLFDIENDGDLDIIAINNLPNPLFERKGVVYKNDGSGNFTVSNFDTGNPYTGLAIGHLNANSDADIIVMNALNNQDSLFMFKDINTGNTKVLIDPNLSDNTFTDNSNVTKLIDIDFDGDLDIVVFNSAEVNIIYFNDGTAEFTKMVLTNDIRVTPDTDFQDFDGDGDLDFTTIRGVQINDGSFNFSLVDYNFKLSNNNAHVLMSDVNGDGQLNLINGAGEWLEFTPSGYAFDVIVNGASAGTTRWVLTSELGMILSIDDQDPPLNYDLLPLGTYHLYYIVYSGSLTGLTEGQNISNIAGDFDLSNNIILNSAPCVEECLIEGGTIDLFNSTYCVGDGVSDFVTGDVIGSAGAVQQIIVTDADSTIIDLPETLNFDVDLAPAGDCIVWNLASNDSIPLMVGMHIDAVQSECFDLSSGATFTRIANTAGMVSLSNGMTIDTVCAADNIQDAFAFVSNGAESDSFQFVITNDVDAILALPISNSFNFDALPFGQCRIYGVAYSGLFPMEVGDTLVVDQSNGCFSISSNFITILKEDCTATLEAGSIALIDGTTFFCPGDSTGLPLYGALTTHFFNLGLTGGIGEVDIDGDIYPDYIMSSDKFIWIEYDENTDEVSMNEIYTATSFISTFETVDIDGDGDFDIVFTTADAPQQVNLLTNDGALNFTFTQIDTGIQNVSSFNPTDFDNDGDIDILVAARMPGNSDELRLYTNDGSLVFTKSVIANIDPIWDVEVADLDMNGEKDLIVSRNANETTLIYYNPITTDEEVVLDAFVSGEPRLKTIDFDNDGDLDITSTAGGGLTLYTNVGSKMFEERVLISFLSGILYDIQDFDNDGDLDVIGDGGLYINNGLNEFDAAPVGTGMLHNIFTDVNADGILDGLFPGGWIENGASGYTFDVVKTNASMDTSRWVLTDSQGVIVSIEEGDSPLTYDLMPMGEYFLYSISYQDTLSGLVLGEPIGNISGTFDLSNAITLNSAPCMELCEADGGTITTSTGESSISFCVGDSMPDSLFLSTTSADSGYIYVVTDSTGLVFGFVEDGVLEFDNAPEGMYLVSGIAYQGDLLLEEDVDIDTFMISTICSEFSTNTIEVVAMATGGPCEMQSNPDLSIVVNRVGEGSQIFDIKNVSSDTIDVSDYWICLKENNYFKLSSVNIECGSFSYVMAPGDILGLNLSVDNADGEIGIYNSPTFDDPNAMLHYVEWGSTGHGRSDEAIAAGLWSAGDFVPSIANTQSIYFSGFGYSSASWTEGDTDLCGEVLIQSNIVFSRVSDNSQVIDLENTGTDTIDINDYFIEQGSNAYRVGDLIVECGNGSRILGPGEKVGLVIIPMSNVAGELALFTSAENSSFGFVADYVQWGDAGFPHESQAVASGVWTTSAFVPSFTSGQSIYYDGEGDAVSDWQEGLTQFCGELTSTQKRIEVNISPNPAVDQMAIKIMRTERTIEQMQIVDGTGKVVFSANMEMNNNDIYRMGIDQLAPGIYFLKMKSSNAIVTERFMVVK